MSPINLYTEALMSNMTVFGDGGSKKEIKVKWDHKGGTLIQQRHQSSPMLLPTEERPCEVEERPCEVEERTCEVKARRGPSTSQEKSSHQKLTLMALWSWTSSLHNHGKINFSCLSHLSCYGSPSRLIGGRGLVEREDELLGRLFVCRTHFNLHQVGGLPL